MKKVFALILAAIFALSCLYGCTITSKKALYQEALNQLEQIQPNFDGTCNNNQALLQAIYNEEFIEPKNFIFMIGDGMGFNAVKAAQLTYKDKLYNSTLAMNSLPIQSSQSTYSASSETTDSAAGGTALSTGHKTSNSTIAMNKDATESYKTTLELAAEKGKSTGLVATKSITDATPASFSAHVSTRGQQTQIAAQQLQKMADGSLNLVLGGGASFYEDAQNAEYLQAAEENGLTYTKNWDEAANAALPLAGLFATGQLDTQNAPSVARMTDLALSLLAEDENGFFLMVEGSQIDSGGHANDLEYETRELYDFDDAVAIAMRFVAFNPDTVLIITADHETGGLHLPFDTTAENLQDTHYYTTGGHTYVNVPVYALGYGTEALAGANENTDLAIFVANLMGEETFGTKSNTDMLIDISDESTQSKFMAENPDNVEDNSILCKQESIQFTLCEDNPDFVIPIDAFLTAPADIVNPRKIHFTVSNPTDQPISLPNFEISTRRDLFLLNCAFDTLEPNETRTITYIIPYAICQDKFEGLYSLTFLYEEAEPTTIEISDFYVTERGIND